jgi:hypothetical protein
MRKGLMGPNKTKGVVRMDMIRVRLMEAVDENNKYNKVVEDAIEKLGWEVIKGLRDKCKAIKLKSALNDLDIMGLHFNVGLHNIYVHIL